MKNTDLWRPEGRVFCANARGVEDNNRAHFMVVHLRLRRALYQDILSVCTFLAVIR